MEEFTKRLSVSQSTEFDCESDGVWRMISEPGNLNRCHPFCKSNEVIRWDKENHSDRLVYLNELNYIRNFITWDEGLGYSLLIGEEGGPQSYVVWEINSVIGHRSELRITVYVCAGQVADLHCIFPTCYLAPATTQKISKISSFRIPILS